MFKLFSLYLKFLLYQSLLVLLNHLYLKKYFMFLNLYELYFFNVHFQQPDKFKKIFILLFIHQINFFNFEFSLIDLHHWHIP